MSEFEEPSNPEGLKRTTRPEEKLDFEGTKKRIKNTLLALNNADSDAQKVREQIGKDLNRLDKKLAGLEKKYPQDNELATLRLMLNDLKDDLQKNENPNLDSSFEEILKLMQAEIKSAGVHREKPRASVVKNTVRRLQDIGIEPEYVVTTGNPSAPIVIYFMQIHSNPGLPDEIIKASGVTESQDQITGAITAAVKTKIGNTLYIEGPTAGKKVASKDLNKFRKKFPREMAMMAQFRLNDTQGKSLKMYGIEDNLLHKKTLATIGETNSPMRYRTTAVNVLLAQNVADTVRKNKQKISFITLGAGHESKIGHESEANDKHQLPFSHALAHEGMNVIVVDAATPYFDEEELTTALMAYHESNQHNPKIDEIEPDQR